MRDEDIHIGDILLVRQWDDMVREFGVNEDGDVKTNVGFSKSIRALCGKQFICSDCGLIIDRDYNADINLSRYVA